MSDDNLPPAPSGKPQFQDITLYDKDTGEPFIFTAKEQEFFAKQGFTHVPAHSPERRKLLREKRYKGKPIFNVRCLSCGKVGKITQEPPDPKHILCQFCFADRWNPYLAKHPELHDTFQPVDPSPPPPAAPEA
jgi:hypothetical protein